MKQMIHTVIAGKGEKADTLMRSAIETFKGKVLLWSDDLSRYLPARNDVDVIEGRAAEWVKAQMERRDAQGAVLLVANEESFRDAQGRWLLVEVAEKGRAFGVRLLACFSDPYFIPEKLIPNAEMIVVATPV